MGISLLLHFLLLWPTAAQRPDEEPLPALMATLRQPSVPAPAPAAAAAPRREEARHGAPREAVLPAPAMTAPGVAPSIAPPLPQGEIPSAPPAPAAVSAAPPASAAATRDSAAEGMRQYRLALAVEARRHKRYPPRALDAGIGGTAEVRIDLVEGHVAEVTLARPSGDASLDAAALEMIRKAAPRAALPEPLRRRSFAVSLPVVFDPDE